MNWFRKLDKMDFFLPERYNNPYPLYKELRHHSPVHYFKKHGFWVISRYEDVNAILKNPADFSSVGLVTKMPDTIFDKDLQDHASIRQRISKAFSPKRLQRLEDWARELALKMVDELTEGGSGDFVNGLALPFPVSLVIKLLKLDPAYYDDYIRWSNAVAFETIGKSMRSKELKKLEREVGELDVFCLQHVTDYRQKKQENPFNEVFLTKEESDRLSIAETAALMKVVLVAGSETTTNFLANLIVTLLKKPDILSALHANSELIPGMIEEALRYNAPSQYVFRCTTKDVKIAGKDIPKGSKIMVLLGSANRDETQFPDPDKFLLSRNPRGHFAFGTGPHYCIGIHLARMEARLTLEAFFERVKSFRCAHALEELVYNKSLSVRRPQKLDLLFELK